MRSEEYKALDKILIKKTVTELKKNNFDVIEVGDGKEALQTLLKLIPQDVSIGYGGSRTLEEIGFFEQVTLDTHPNLFDRKSGDLSPDEKQTLQRRALVADVFISSANALSQDGEFVLIDKWGNRNAAMTYGPTKRIIVVGANKITSDLSSAIKRAQDRAAVLNNIRFDTKNPCVKSGRCMNCDSSERLCSIITIIQRCQPPGSITVILSHESLGF